MNTYAADELQYYSTYDYDSEGFVEKELHYDGSDQLINTVIWNYDAQRHCIGFHAYNPDDTLWVHEVRELFVEGWWTKISYYDGQGILTEYSVFVRLADGRIDTQSDFDSSDGLQSSVRWQYNSQGRMTKVSFFHPDGTPNGYNAFTYDTEGFETAEKFYNSADVLNYASIYEYDGTTGNRTKTTFYTYSGGNPSPGGYDTYEYAEAPSADS
jgi:hypothetical protein